ncbi:MAG: hypothetical protein ACLTNY_03215, partial [Blautia massiliensis (ex Durand et al. 2017)]
ERALQAGFDERISLVSLLLAGLNTRFAAARSADAVTDTCYQQLRSYRRKLDQNDGADAPAALFAALCRAFRARLEEGKAAGTLPPEEAAVRARAAALLESWSGTLGDCAEACL